MKIFRSSILVLALSVISCGESGVVGDESNEIRAYSLLGPELRMGSLDDPDYAFRRVAGISVSPGGRVFSQHSGEMAIRRWSAEGLPDGTIGREGEGPGEFQAVGSMGFFGDTLWVMDRRQSRISYFDADGALLGSASPLVDLGSRDTPYQSPPRPNHPLRNGNLVGSAPAWSSAVAEGNLTETPWVQMDSEGGVLNTIWTQEYRTRDVLALLREGGGGTFGNQPFGDQPLIGSDYIDGAVLVVDRRVYTGEGEATIEVRKIDIATGDTIFSRPLAYAPRRLTSVEADSTIDAMAENMHPFMGRSDPGLTLASLRDDIAAAMFLPEYVPGFRAMFTAEDGRIFLQSFDSGEDASEWLILDSAADVVGRIEVPTGVRILRIQGDELWGVETDELDVNYIVKYLIVE